ncbi:cell division protein FtsA [Hellea sp.]|nr:cell division protein FtsA [Hellea sp.]
MFNKGNSKNIDTIAVVDIGSTKVVCLIAQREPSLGIKIIGTGISASQGLKCGAVVDMEAAEKAIRSAVAIAEKKAGVTVQSVHVNVAIKSIQSKNLSVQTEFASGIVNDRNCRRVLDYSLTEISQPENTILHAIPLNWSVDDERGILDPRGMFGNRLGVDMHCVIAGIGPLRNLAHCIERSHLRMSSVMVSPYAAGVGVLTADERDLGVALIDMGGGITTISIFHDNNLMNVDALPIGGKNVTLDIARGLTTPLEAAERIKRVYGSALHGSHDDSVMIPCPPMGAQDELAHHPHELLTSIIRSRVEETFEILKEKIWKSGQEVNFRRIVLTGGGSQLNGVRELAEYVFNKKVRIGIPHGVMGLNESISDPDFSVVIGLLKHAFDEAGEAIDGPPDLSGQKFRKKRYKGNPLGKTLYWLKENF